MSLAIPSAPDFYERKTVMELFLTVLVLSALVCAPYAFIAYKRARMIKRLRYVAKKTGFRVRRLHRFPFLSLNRARSYDLLFENKNHAYAVKLWSSVKKNTTLYVNSRGRIYERTSVPCPFEPSKRPSYELRGGIRRVPVTANNFQTRRGKLVVGILLFYPPYREILMFDGKERRTVEYGEMLFEKIICNPGNFEEILQEDFKNLNEASQGITQVSEAKPTDELQ